MAKPPQRPFWDLLLQEWLLKVERFFYIIVALLILMATGIILWDGARTLTDVLYQKAYAPAILRVMDRFLLALMFLEILHTVQIVFGEEYHLACIEPFLMVGIIATVRRLLLLSFETSHAGEVSMDRLRYYMFEMVIMGVLILALVGAVVLLRRSRR